MIVLVMIIPYAIGIFGAKQETMSYEWRVGDLQIGIGQFLKHPVLGKGVGDESFHRAFADRFGFERANSNGWMRLILASGFIGMLLYVISSYRFGRWIEDNGFKNAKIAFIVWLGLSLLNEPIESCAFILFLVGIGWHSKAITRHERVAESKLYSSSRNRLFRYSFRLTR